MRTTLNISIPKELKHEVEKQVKAGNYASVSEFFRDAVRSWKEEQLVKEIRESRAEIARGEGKILRSLADLD
ncbi:ribbon-helix-helix domain-containing protein [Patescibacteria group bacterium]|nr:ribbon-helix-helix domain-containing protein [Patescibacteria group bacterium]